jgi:hypothetical protein
MHCPSCSNAITVRESFRIHNPFDFACPHCVTRLHVGPRGKVVLFASAVAGVLAALVLARLWRDAGLRQDDALFAVMTGFGVLALLWQWLALRLSDLRSRGKHTGR